VQKQGGEVLPYLPDLHTLILFVAFLILAGVVPDASVSLLKSPSLFNDASRNAAAHTHGFFPARSLLFLSRISTADLTIDAGRSTLAANVLT
jgi:hypothetical protein